MRWFPYMLNIAPHILSPIPVGCIIWALFPNRPICNMMANWTSIKTRRRLIRLTILLTLGGALTIWSSSVDFAAPPHPSHLHASSGAALSREDRAVEVLRRALLSMEHTYFSGEQTILTFDEGDGAACVTQETHL